MFDLLFSITDEDDIPNEIEEEIECFKNIQKSNSYFNNCIYKI